MSILRTAQCALALALCAGCAVYDVPARSRPTVGVPASFSGGGSAAARARWWEEFEDPGLTTLVTQALEANLDLQSSWARLEQAAALARQAGARLLPEVTLEGGASRSRSDITGAGPARTNFLSLGLAASYELDLWGRVRAGRQAAGLDAGASREDLEAAAVTLAGTVGELWYSLVEERAQRKLLAQQIRSSRTLLDLVELRFAQGLASALDVYQQRQQLATTRGQVPGIESRLQVTKHQLAVLLARPPTDEVAPKLEKLPDPPPLPKTGLPAELLERRPDVRAALLRLRAADHRVAAAVAERLPSVSLSGGLGFASNSTTNLVERRAWDYGARLLAPVFDAGRRAAEVSRSKAVVAERLAVYSQTILTAFREVEDALVQERRQRESLASIEEREGLAQSTLRQARLRYANGLSDYLPVLAAVQSLQQVQRARITARRQLISFRIQLYRALAGSWTNDLAPAKQGRPVAATVQRTAPGDSQ